MHTTLLPTFAVVLFCAAATPVFTQESTIPIERAEAMFQLADRLAEDDGGKLWGVSLAGPLLFVDPQTRAVVANLGDPQGWLVQHGNVWLGKLPEHLQPSNTSLEWAGVRWTMVMWSSLTGSKYDRGRLLMHESFHRIQPDLGHEALSPGNAHLDEETGRAWLRLEMRALAEALIRDGKDRQQAAIDAATFRKVRHALVGETAAAEEISLEANEGLAEYTGVRLAGLPEAAQQQRVAVDLERRDSSPTLTRSFAYATGPALALLLDQHEPDWKTSLKQDFNLADRLLRALNEELDGGDLLIAQATSLAVAKYDGAQVFTEERERSIRRAERLAELQTKFAPGSALKIETGPQFRFSFNPNTAESLDAQRIFYKPLSASDVWGTVEAPEGALIDFNSPMSLHLPVPSGASPELVPWTLKLNAGFELDTSQDDNWKIVPQQ